MDVILISSTADRIAAVGFPLYGDASHFETFIPIEIL